MNSTPAATSAHCKFCVGVGTHSQRESLYSDITYNTGKRQLRLSTTRGTVSKSHSFSIITQYLTSNDLKQLLDCDCSYDGHLKANREKVNREMFFRISLSLMCICL